MGFVDALAQFGTVGSVSDMETRLDASGGTFAPLKLMASITFTSPPPPPPASAGGLPDLTALTRLLPLLSGMGQDNDDTRLLLALRPYLHGGREQRLDESVRLLKLLRLLPLLQEQGIVGGDGGGR